MIDARKFEALVRHIDPHCRLLRTWVITGGVSARVTGLEIEQADGSIHKMIVRQHGSIDLQRNPNIAVDEFKLLNMLHTAGLPVPQPYYVEETGAIFGTPCVVLEFIEGAPDFAPPALDDFIRTIAATLTQIHSVDVSNPDLALLPQLSDLYAKKIRHRPARLDNSIGEGRIRDTLQAAWPLPQLNKTTLLHGDYWPGNLMWQNGKMTAVVDWEDAMLGDPLSDIGNCRFELTWAFGIEAMQQFTRHYTALRQIDLTTLPYWDLVAALRPAGKITEWASDAAQEKRMRDGHNQFVTQAFERLSH